MSFETGLNILWVLVVAAALSALVRTEMCRKRTTWPARAMRTFAVLFAILFLFPCVSESDDLLTLQNVQFTLETRGEVGNPLPQRSSDEKPGVQLARFFEGLQPFPIAALCALLLTLLFVAILAPATALARDRRLPAFSGRAPPVASFA